MGVTYRMGISGINLGHTGNIGKRVSGKATEQRRPEVVGYLRNVI